MGSKKYKFLLNKNLARECFNFSELSYIVCGTLLNQRCCKMGTDPRGKFQLDLESKTETIRAIKKNHSSVKLVVKLSY